MTSAVTENKEPQHVLINRAIQDLESAVRRISDLHSTIMTGSGDDSIDPLSPDGQPLADVLQVAPDRITTAACAIRDRITSIEAALFG